MPSRSLAITGVVLIGFVHLITGLLPDPPLSNPTNLVMLVANLYVFFCACLVLRDESNPGVGLFVAGYMVLFLLVLVLLERESLFILLIILYASVYRIKVLLGVFAIFIFSFVLAQPYAVETFIPLASAVLAVWKIRKNSASGFTVFCLAIGLFGLMIIAIPLIHLCIQDSPRTLQFVLMRPEVQQAIWLSLFSSALSTGLVALWGIPLAYALARSEFRGKGLIESLIDVPILVPQSVVGIALLAILGPGAPLGNVLDELGLSPAGNFAGIVLAQTFVSCPFLIKSAQNAFESVPTHFEDVSRTLGAGAAKTFFLVTTPLASRGILTGVILAWARSISEFGTLILFASHPQTAPILVHNEFLKAGISESRPIAVLLLLACLWIFIILQFGKTLLPGASRSKTAKPRLIR